jgi:hypothetical protein
MSELKSNCYGESDRPTYPAGTKRYPAGRSTANRVMRLRSLVGSAAIAAQALQRQRVVAPRLLPCVLTLLVAACATPHEERADYPASFPKPARTTAECPAFIGYFRNAGAYIAPDGSRSSALFTRDVLQLVDAFPPDDDIRLSIDSRVTGAFGVPALFGHGIPASAAHPD